MIAMAMSCNPKLIIADEPVSALDVSIQTQILNLLVDLQRQFGPTYIFISHDLGVVRHLCDRVAVMYLSRIVETAESRDLYAHPLHPYTRALLSAVPVANPAVKRNFIPTEGYVPSSINPPAGCAFQPRCAFRRQICAQKEPEMEQLKPGYEVACYFPLI